MEQHECGAVAHAGTSDHQGCAAHAGHAADRASEAQACCAEKAENAETDASPEPPRPEVLAKLVAGQREFLRFLERRVGSRAEAEDLLQDAFAKAVEHAGAIRDDESAVAWFYRALRNAVVDHHRRRGAAARGLDAFAREVGDAHEPPPELASAVCACIRTLSESLSPSYADALRRVEVDGLSVQDFAAEAGISANNAGVRVHRARAALRERVVATCGVCCQHGCVDCTCEKISSPPV